ncbi:MAG: AI-2E family transporter [Methanomicrobiaceae archaeon]|nr:AI-2E family transporter [Methanomicrobiaceae archaeon]
MRTDPTRHDLLTPAILGIFFLGITIILWPLMSVLILSMSVAVVCLPFHHRLSRHMSDGASAAMTTTGLFLLLAVVASAVLFLLYDNAGMLLSILTNFIHAIQALLQDSPFVSRFADEIARALTSLVTFVAEYISDLALALPFLLVQVIIFFCSFYLYILKGEYLLGHVIRRLPDRTYAAVRKLTHITGDTLYSVYIVSFEISVYTFLVSMPVFYLLGYGNVILFSLLAALLQLIPVFGPQILLGLLALYALSIGDTSAVLFLVVVAYPVISLSADFFVRPRLMGRRMAINPVLMMIGVFGGLALLGVIGFILGPLFTALAVSAYEILMGETEEGELSA